MSLAEKIKVLIVDDQVTSRLLLSDALTQLGFKQITAAGDGEQGMKIMEQQPHHLVISDFNMPKMDGLGLLQAVRTNPTTKKAAFSVPALPQSTSINGAGLPEHAVTMTVTSDASILQLGYRVAYGKSSKRVAYQVQSPVRVQAVGRGYGLVAVIAAQASPYATYLTCTVTVDGTVRTHRTVRGGFQVVVCYG